jgi:hypothetical protein
MMPFPRRQGKNGSGARGADAAVKMNKPIQLDPLAEKLLARLAGKPECAEIVLGGYFALEHYLDYRQTHDVDAWWRTQANRTTGNTIEEAMRRVASTEALEFSKRLFGDTATSCFGIRSGYSRFESPSAPSSWSPRSQARGRRSLSRRCRTTSVLK